MDTNIEKKQYFNAAAHCRPQLFVEQQWFKWVNLWKCISFFVFL